MRRGRGGEKRTWSNWNEVYDCDGASQVWLSNWMVSHWERVSPKMAQRGGKGGYGVTWFCGCVWFVGMEIVLSKVGK